MSLCCLPLSGILSTESDPPAFPKKVKKTRRTDFSLRGLCKQTGNLLLKNKLKKANATLYDGTQIGIKRRKTLYVKPF